MLSIAGDVKLIDFGLATDISKGNKKQMVGSSFWMPPEVIKGISYGPLADIWSFGMTLAEIANREVAHKHSAIRALVATVMGSIPSLNDSTWSACFREFMTRCLVVDPDKRFNAEELYKLDFIAKGPVRETFITSVEQIFLAQVITF